MTDLFAVQPDIAASVARALQVKLAPEHPGPRPTEDEAAYELWVRGRSMSQQYTPSAFAEARRCYEAAIERDPLFARPHFGLAELLFYSIVYGLTTSADDVTRARQAMGRALELDDRFGDAHGLCGVFRGMFDYDWPGAEAAFGRALALSPGSSSIRMQHAWYYLAPRGRTAEAVAEGLKPFQGVWTPESMEQDGKMLDPARLEPGDVSEDEAAAVSDAARATTSGSKINNRFMKTAVWL